MTGSVGQNIPHDSARGHVTGESIYIDDIPFSRGELIVDFLGSPIAHGRLNGINLEAARQVPGIAGLFTAGDLEGQNALGPIFQDEVLLVPIGGELMYIGHPVVVIAGESRQAIARAKQCIRLDYDPLKPVFTIDEAKTAGEFIGPTRVIERGDAEGALKTAPHVITGVFRNGGQEHFYLESQACIAYPGENNTLTVHSSTQHPTEVQHDIAKILGLQQKDVVCITRRMGGAFGGKESQATHPAVMAALVALKTRRPARFAIDKDNDMRTTGKRHPFQNDYRVGFDADGRITGMIVDLYSDGGAANDLSTAVMGRAMCHAENAYYIPHVRITGTICRTNYPPNTAFRGFGGPQGMANMENIIEEIAAYLNKDPLEVRRVNCYGTDDRNVTPYGQTVRHMLPELIDTLAQRSDYQARMAAVAQFNATSKTHLKGLSMTLMKFGISFNTKFLNQANALVNIYVDGSVQVSTGATEMGQGVNTKIRQIVADELSIDVNNVTLMPTSTEKNNNTSATAASSGSDLNGAAAADACRKIRARLTEFAGEYFASLSGRGLPEHHRSATTPLTRGEELALDCDPPRDGEHPVVWEKDAVYDRDNPRNRLSFKELVKLAYLARVSLGERGWYATQGIDWNWEAGEEKTGQGSPFLYFTTGCAVSEVLIDRFTGDLKVLRSDILMDIGQSINPGIDRGQITGAFIQGMGWVTAECLRYSETGELLSHSPTTYKIPNIQDVPEVFNVDWLENDRNDVNIRRSKAVGEPPLMLALSVWTAVKHALRFVTPAGEIPRLDLPATNEEILHRLTQARKHHGHAVTPVVEPVSEPLP